MARFNKKLDDNFHLTMAVFNGRRDPDSDNIIVQIRRRAIASDGRTETWVTHTRMAIHRYSDRRYVQLPDRQDGNRGR